MKSTEVHLTFTYYFAMIFTALLVQFVLAAFLLGLNWDALSLTERSDEENLHALKTYSMLDAEGMSPAVLSPSHIARSNPAIQVGSAPGQTSGMELGSMTPRHRPSHRATSVDQDHLDIGAVTMKLSASAGHIEEHKQRGSGDLYDGLEPDGFAEPTSENISETESDTTRRPTLAAFDSHSSQRPLLPAEDIT